jgi:hypothetical protein
LGLSGRAGARLFPNPAGSRVAVQANGFVFYSLRDATGRRLTSGKSEGHAFFLELSHLPDGMFSLLLEGETRTEVLRLVKQTGAE